MMSPAGASRELSSAMPSLQRQLCAPGRIRTPNLLIRSQTLYQLSYGRKTEAQRRPGEGL